jgi:2-keto-3-deoxy-L-rhamnonate aldolase RhmA
MIRANSTISRLRLGEPVMGVGLSTFSPELVELSSAQGFDFVTIDAEHEPFTDREIAELIRAADAFEITPIVRIANDAERILRALDSGAQGIQVPRCRTASDVETFIRSSLFHPNGTRTFYNLGRSGNYATGVNDQLWARTANEELLLIATIEEKEAVENIGEILALPGLGAIHIGPKDLWQSLGMPTHEEVRRAIDLVIDAAARAGVPVSMYQRPSADGTGQLRAQMERGVSIFTVPLYDLVKSAAATSIGQLSQARTAPAEVDPR